MKMFNIRRTAYAITAIITIGTFKLMDITKYLPSNKSMRQSSHENATAKPFCKSASNIVFLKTHKTASSAIQNVLFRYGLKRRLKFAFPKKGFHFDYPKLFKEEFIFPKGNGKYNIICHHMRFNYEAIKEIMPADSLYLSIVREPGSLFESIFDYNWANVPAFQKVPHHAKNSAEKWLDNAAEFVKNSPKAKYSLFAQNPTYFTFGYDQSDERNISTTIGELDEIFDLVLVADHMDESLVLLADLLRCDLEDVASLTVNARVKSKMSESVKSRLSDKARRWNKADAALFDHFNASLWRKVKQYGHQKMAQQVQRLKLIATNISETCTEGGKLFDFSKVDPKSRQGIYMPKNVPISNYKLKNGTANFEVCQQFLTPELPFTTEIKRIQTSRELKSTSATNTFNKL